MGGLHFTKTKHLLSSMLKTWDNKFTAYWKFGRLKTAIYEEYNMTLPGRFTKTREENSQLDERVVTVM